ncbi:nucleotidyltransferase family protein [Paenibacillus eucommiae]|uniref:D-glycero-alpha-D-manno-heptose 1-phosphate guanylyltransferase n=1 Tax=Paenibacillus eucommiae TaxID=1355755 RepID=A0ABS4IU98_9BACL|nr:nucleotidyltransferase family protein [Paenibacillus eucommiae]MBP1991145.1 D-glycero-alpha-D-manno-heptose 1-phosphate guanylyltransferase [Paenibacillus eucommiae]
MEAIVLAGGKGTRLQTVISDVPKPMALIKGKPFLCYILDELSHQGFSKVIISVGYKKELIIDYFGEDYRNLKIQYAEEFEPLGTGGAIKKALELTSEANLFVLNGDTYFDVDYKSLMKQQIESKADLTIVLKEMKNIDRYGTVVTEGSRVVKFNEKQPAATGKINGGIYLLKRYIFKQLDLPEKFSFESDFMQVYYDKLEFFGYISDGYFIDIGIPEDYYKAQKELK